MAPFDCVSLAAVVRKRKYTCYGRTLRHHPTCGGSLCFPKLNIVDSNSASSPTTVDTALLKSCAPPLSTSSPLPITTEFEPIPAAFVEIERCMEVDAEVLPRTETRRGHTRVASGALAGCCRPFAVAWLLPANFFPVVRRAVDVATEVDARVLAGGACGDGNELLVLSVAFFAKAASLAPRDEPPPAPPFLFLLDCPGSEFAARFIAACT